MVTRVQLSQEIFFSLPGSHSIDQSSAVLYRPELERNLAVCPKCSSHMPLSGRTRLEHFLDPGEQRDVAAQHPAEVERLKAICDAMSHDVPPENVAKAPQKKKGKK